MSARRAIGKLAKEGGVSVEGRPALAIGNEFKLGDFVMNLLRRFASLHGSRGARWGARVPLERTVYFQKWAASARVTATAREALARGLRVALIEPAIAGSNDRSKARARAPLARRSAKLAA